MGQKRTGGRGETFLTVGLVCGLVGGVLGVALDLDHILVLWRKGLPITWRNLATQAGRPLHLPATVVSGLLCLIFGALRVGRLVVRSR